LRTDHQCDFEHGRFTPEATRQTAAALQFYAIGLAAYSAVKVLAPAFYALITLPSDVSAFSQSRLIPVELVFISKRTAALRSSRRNSAERL